MNAVLPYTKILPEEVSRNSACAIWKVHPLLWLLMALSPVIVWYGKRLDDGSDEPLGLLTLALALILAWRDRASLSASARSRVCGAGLVLASAMAVVWLPPMLRALIAVSGVAVFFGIHRRGGLIGLLLLSLPVVASLQFFIGYPMRVAVAEGVVRLLEMGSVVVARSGVQIEVGGRVIGVDPACSGVRMLWHALVAAMGLAAFHRLSWRATLVMGLLSVVLVVPANILRAFVLVFEETGYWEKSEVLHGGIGLASFGMILIPLWLVGSRHTRPATVAMPSAAPDRRVRLVLMLPAVIAPALALATPRTPLQSEIGPEPTSFTFDGLTLPLDPLPSSPAEFAFAKSFPGTLSSHRWGDDQVILRRVTEATRRLHPSRDCLRAAGFETSDAVTVTRPDGSEWSRFSAVRDGERLLIHERIVSERDRSAWTDVSAWYWAALRHPLNGPWQAVTVISRP
ncbi:MAG: exosortase/archaeosortase family protein [Luteolibacter sp.]